MEKVIKKKKGKVKKLKKKWKKGKNLIERLKHQNIKMTEN